MVLFCTIYLFLYYMSFSILYIFLLIICPSLDLIELLNAELYWRRVIDRDSVGGRTRPQGFCYNACKNSIVSALPGLKNSGLI